MAVNVQSGLGGSLHVALHVGKVHIAVGIHATAHLHGVASHGFGKVLVHQVSECLIGKVIVHGGADAQFKVGVLVIVDVIFQGLIIVEIAIVAIVRFTLFKFLLSCHGCG